MKNRTAITLTAMAGLLTLGTAAEALPLFTYDLTTPSGSSIPSPQSLTSTPDAGFPGTLSALRNTSAGTFNINTSGTGVQNTPPRASLGAGNVGKNDTVTEKLKITIPEVAGVHAYRLVSATFANVLPSPDEARKFGITVDDKSCTFTLDGMSSTITVNNFTSLAGKNFEFFVVNDQGRFRLNSATFETVPEPLTILGTGFAAAALPALKKANKKAKK